MKRKYILTAFWTTCLRVSWAVGATFDVPSGNVQSLREAIIKSNASQELNIINLEANGVYHFSNYFLEIKGREPEAGAVALPPIQSNTKLIINGNGATLKRDNSAAKFRFMVLGSRSEVVINNTFFENGYSEYAGGAVVVGYQATLSVNSCKFLNNYAGAAALDYGGGAIYTKSLSKLSVASSEFKANRAGNSGGAIHTFLSSVNIENSKFVENQCVSDQGKGGALFINGANGDEGKIRLYNSLWVMNGAAMQGGAIVVLAYNQEKVLIDKCVLSDNKVWAEHSTGGALWANADELDIPLQLFERDKDRTRLDIQRCVFSNNTAVEAGGAIWLGDGHVQIDNSMISHNNVGRGDGTGGYGGGVYALSQSVKLQNSTVTNNYAGNSAGGVFSASQAKVVLGNTTVAYNVANKLVNKTENCGAIYTTKATASRTVKLSEKTVMPSCNDNLLVSPSWSANNLQHSAKQQTISYALRDMDVILFENITKIKTPRFRRLVAAIFAPADTTVPQTTASRYAHKMEHAPASAWMHLSPAAQKQWLELMKTVK